MPVLSGAVGSVRGAAGAIALWRKGGRMRKDGHFVVRTTAALPPPPVWIGVRPHWSPDLRIKGRKNGIRPQTRSFLRMEIPDQVGDDDKQVGKTASGSI